MHRRLSGASPLVLLVALAGVSATTEAGQRPAGPLVLQAHRLDEVSLERGTFWTGDRTGYEVELTLRPKPGIALSTEWSRDVIALPDGAFRTSLVRLLGERHASPSISLTINVQYDDVSELIRLFGRLRWILNPGNDLFIVYNHHWLYDDRQFVTLSRGGTMKLTYTQRL